MSDLLGLFRLDGRVAIVTGASSGFGSRFVEVLAGAGASVVLAARRLDRLESIAAGLPGGGHLAVGCDVSRDSDVEALVAAAIGRHGRVDIVVNNAGVSHPEPAETEAPAHFRYVMDVNLTAAFVLSQLVGRHMLEGHGGSIVNVASVLGMGASGQVPQAGYAASKGGLINLTRELAVQWARSGIRVNALCPGWFPTEMTGEMFEDESGLRWIRRHTPMGRGGRVEELDGALLFLASDASSYVTGALLAVDGGWTAV
jgi:NAD(P)-dependent dehydrogenase (short-subunit alcohol dehydrogenase family)